MKNSRITRRSAIALAIGALSLAACSSDPTINNDGTGENQGTSSEQSSDNTVSADMQWELNRELNVSFHVPDDSKNTTLVVDGWRHVIKDGSNENRFRPMLDPGEHTAYIEATLANGQVARSDSYTYTQEPVTKTSITISEDKKDNPWIGAVSDDGSDQRNRDSWNLVLLVQGNPIIHGGTVTLYDNWEKKDPIATAPVAKDGKATLKIPAAGKNDRVSGLTYYAVFSGDGSSPKATNTFDNMSYPVKNPKKFTY